MAGVGQEGSSPSDWEGVEGSVAGGGTGRAGTRVYRRCSRTARDCGC
jgi:hypothetical protein